MPDKFTVEILEDGTLKVETDRISSANHLSAEAFMRDVARLTAGPSSIKHKHSHGRHAHTHGNVTHQH